MGKKPGNSIKSVAKEGDEFKKKVDRLIKEGDKLLSKPNATNYTEKVKDCHQRVVDLQLDIDDLLQRLEGLTEAAETSKVTNFTGKQSDEKNRLLTLKENLDILGKKLEPDDVESDYYRTFSSNRTLQDATEEASELEGEPDEEEYDDEVTADEEEEEVTEDEEGVDDEGEEEEEEEEEEESEEEDEELGTGDEFSDIESELNVEYEAVCNRNAEQNEDLTFRKGDILRLKCIRSDGWWECENEQGKVGLVPGNFMKEHNKYQDVQVSDTLETQPDDEKTPRGVKLWQSLRSALTETSATDVLHALGAVPTGFREPSLAKLHNQNEKYRMVNTLFPKLSSSNLFFKDLFYNPETDRVRRRVARIQKVVSLVGCSQVPAPGAGVIVRQRLVRVCLFDGKNILSNIHTVRAQSNDKEGRQWIFNSKISDVMSSLDYGDFFFRTAKADDHTGLLFEFTYTYIKGDSNKECEIACGWVKLPLFGEDGSMLLNKQYNMRLNGGTPWEKGVEVDPTISRKAASRLKALISKTRQPVLTVKVTAATKEQKEELDVLPDTIVSNLIYLNSISLYRQVLGDHLLRDKMNIQATELLHAPFLVNFPKAVDMPDLMDILRSSLLDKMKRSKKSDKRDVDTMKDLIQAAFVEWVFPFMYLSSAPAYELGNQQVEQMRRVELDKCIKLGNPQSSLQSLLSPDISHESFDLSQVGFNLTNQLCLSSV